MNEKEALTRIKTGNFNGGYGFDMQLLVDAVGIIGEMFKSGQISEVVRCKDCEKWQEDKLLGLHYCEARRMNADDYCSKAIRRREE